MNEHTCLEKLRQTALHGIQRQQLAEKISAVFTIAIDARSPKKRPPGKAGLRAEKGYYRLLYLEGDFKEKAIYPEQADRDTPAGGWEHLTEILRQMDDLPELRSEILAGIASAVDEIVSQSPGEDEIPYVR